MDFHSLNLDIPFDANRGFSKNKTKQNQMAKSLSPDETAHNYTAHYDQVTPT